MLLFLPSFGLIIHYYFFSFSLFDIFFHHFFLFQLTFSITSISFRCTAQWLDVYNLQRAPPNSSTHLAPDTTFPVLHFTSPRLFCSYQLHFSISSTFSPSPSTPFPSGNPQFALFLFLFVYLYCSLESTYK